ncbi:hypothetical protein [Sphingobium sp.]|uniref:hypothetical protein n=1 Tax=Sphingobium sp. TaxID=1912891 RepID=UPI002B5C8F62|nr:hypothetical protein [Sphingobium sp.]HUD94934.1 hypothetical protein [Sphingobium sp.]
MSGKAHFGFTKLVVRNLEAMATFYKEVAGLTEVGRIQDAVGDRKIVEILFQWRAVRRWCCSSLCIGRRLPMRR